MEENQTGATVTATNYNPRAHTDEEIVGDDYLESLMPSKGLTMQKHRLENSWTFWFDNPSAARNKQAAWGSTIRPIYTFNTVEEFWSIYNNVLQPSKLSEGADFHCFKFKIEPKWEDPACSNGGKWAMYFLKGKSDTCWLYTLLAMIGEQYEHGDLICGAVVNVRGRKERVSIWTKNASNEVAQVSIGKQWKELLDYKETIGFISHHDSKIYGRGAENKYTA